MLYIDGLKIVAPSKFSDVYVFWNNEGVADTRPVENISEVMVESLVINEGCGLKLWNNEISTSNGIIFSVK